MPDAVPTHPPRSAPMPIGVIAGLFLASIALRPQLLAIGPLLPMIRDDLGLPASIAGLITTIPVLCMGVFAPIGPRIAARLGPRLALAACLACIAGFGVARAVAPAVPLLFVATFGIGIGVGIAGAVPSMVVSQRLSGRRALGTGAYAAGIVTGSTIAAGVAVPLALGGDWQRSLVLISLASFAPLIAWLVLVRSDGSARPVRARALRLPWASRTAWLLALVFGVQSLLYYAIVAWLPNTLAERGWAATDAGALLAILNAVGLVTTVGVPLIADRVGTRQVQLVASAAASLVAIIGINVAPDATTAWVVVLGLGLGAIFPLVLTLPLDVADDPSQVGAVTALMLLGGYLISSVGPFILGGVRDATGDFGASLWMLAGLAAALVLICLPLSPRRLHRGVHTG